MLCDHRLFPGHSNTDKTLLNDNQLLSVSSCSSVGVLREVSGFRGFGESFCVHRERTDELTHVIGLKRVWDVFHTTTSIDSLM